MSWGGRGGGQPQDSRAHGTGWEFPRLPLVQSSLSLSLPEGKSPVSQKRWWVAPSLPSWEIPCVLGLDGVQVEGWGGCPGGPEHGLLLPGPSWVLFTARALYWVCPPSILSQTSMT